MLRQLITRIDFILAVFGPYGQETGRQLPSRYLGNLSAKINRLERKLGKRTDRALKEMASLESKLKNKLEELDSFKAAEVFGDPQQKYRYLKQWFDGKTFPELCVPSLHTLHTSLRFIENNQELISQFGDQSLKETLASVRKLESQIQRIEEVGSFLEDRMLFLKKQIEQLPHAGRA